METSRKIPGFAVTTQDGVLVVYRGNGNGPIRRWSSADGISWESSQVVDSQQLVPVSSCGETVYCITPEGSLISCIIDGNKLEVASQVAELPSENWYEGPPAPRDVSIHHLAGERVMVFSARRKGKSEKRGCIGMARSQDLAKWRVEPPLLAPNLFSYMQLPHLLNNKGMCTLFYGVQREHAAPEIRHASAPALEGPFQRPGNDILAADIRLQLQTADFKDRMLGFFLYESHQIRTPRPGVLEYTADDGIVMKFFDPLLNLLGKTLFQTEANLSSRETLVRVLPRYGLDFRLELRLRSCDARAAGVLFRTSMTAHDNLTLWLEYESNMLTVRRGVNGRPVARAACPLAKAEENKVTIWVEGGLADVYIDGVWRLSAETEGRKSGGFGLAVLGGEANFTEVTVQSIE